MTQITNCHSHIFTIHNIPERFLPLRLVRYLARNNRTRRLARALNWLNPFSNHDLLDRYANFIRQSDKPNQRAILEDLMSYYPSDSKFVILSMDMEHMEAGSAPQNYRQQLHELVALKQSNLGNQIFPFVCADPRRENLLDFVKSYIDQGFSGIKLYPPLGFWPFDEKLMPVYEYAAQNNLPVLTHCSRGGIYYRGDTDQWQTHPKTGHRLERKRNNKFTEYFTDPANYKYVLEQFPTLKLCFAHFGGETEWNKYLNGNGSDEIRSSWYYIIRKYLENENYPNVYTDISFTLSHLDFVPLLNVTLEIPKVKDHILFGSDFYMVKQESSEFRFSIELRQRLGEEKYKVIAETNPGTFI